MEDTDGTGSGDSRLYGWVIAAASLLAVGAMIRHPSAGGADLRAALQDMVREAGPAAAVHGFLMVTSAALLFGFHGVSERLDHKPLARAGLVAWLIGTFAMFCAMVASGFIVPRLAGAYVAAPAEELEIARGLLRLVGGFNQAWAVVGTVALSAGILCWSLALLRQGHALRWIGWLGLAAGGLPATAVGSGALTLDVHGMLAVVVAQTLWSLAIAVQLIRGRL